MMEELKLYMVLMGCKPKGRYTEQHDVFFGIAYSLKELVPHLKQSWPEAKGNIHIDAWREVTYVDGYRVTIQPADYTEYAETVKTGPKLFFMNLGGYKKNEFEEYHYKMLAVAEDSATAIKQAKQGVFYKHTGFKGAPSHIDDKYGVDVDDVYKIEDILWPVFKEKYTIRLTHDSVQNQENAIHLGYLPIWKIKD